MGNSIGGSFWCDALGPASFIIPSHVGVPAQVTHGRGLLMTNHTGLNFHSTESFICLSGAQCNSLEIDLLGNTLLVRLFVIVLVVNVSC